MNFHGQEEKRTNISLQVNYETPLRLPSGLSAKSNSVSS